MSTPSVLVNDVTDSPASVRRPGIQPGQVVRAGNPEVLEKNLGRAVALAYELVKPELPRILPAGWQLRHDAGFSGTDLVTMMGQQLPAFLAEELRVVGYRPDGGIFSLVSPSGVLIPFLASEAKHQGAVGNAIERWFKNYHITRSMGADMALVTFCTGEGAAYPEGVMCKTLSWALVEYAKYHQRPMRQWNQLYVQGPSLFCAVEGFELEQMVQILRSAIVDGAFFFSRN